MRKKTIVRTQLVVRFKGGKLILVECQKSKKAPESYLPEIELAWRENVTQSPRITLLGFGANDLQGSIPDANGDGAKFIAKLDH